MIKTHDNDGQCYCSRSMLDTCPGNQRNVVCQEQMKIQIPEGDEQLWQYS